MTNLDWFAQFLLASVFLFAGFSKLFAFIRQKRAPQTELSFRGIGLPLKVVCLVALAEIVGALALVVPLHLGQPDNLPLLAATGLALLAMAAGIYRVRHKEPAAPMVTLFLLALFVIVGRWYQ